jgi:ribosomal protein S18 acetylase RimI-like enzyme
MTLNEGDGTERLIGFRLTYAPGQWIDSYDPKLELNPEMWGFDPEKVAYMKSNALDEEFRGGGFGRMLLDRGIAETKRMGAEAAVAHIWMNSPGNSAYNYFTRAGGQLIKTYPSYWTDYHTEDMPCIHCGFPCECPAAEMIIDYSTHKEL